MKWWIGSGAEGGFGRKEGNAGTVVRAPGRRQLGSPSCPASEHLFLFSQQPVIASVMELTGLLLLMLAAHHVRAQQQTIQVLLKQGLVQGAASQIDGVTVYHFLGIPYAEAPVGPKRFRPSAPHGGWSSSSSPYVALHFKPVCPQPSGNAHIRDTMSEDCLFVNVWTPVNPSVENRSRPVVVLLEGQLFTLGNPSDVPAEDFVADQDMLLVSVGYRLNAFGFLSYEDAVLPGNLGLLDQYLALLWVFENIGAFGGNRNQIVLLGHSAGAASAFYHLVSSRSSPYIQRVIMMSGSVLAPWASQVSARSNAIRLGGILGCSNPDLSSSEQLLQCLQSKTMNDIVAGVDAMIKDGNVSALFSPVASESFLESGSRFIQIDPLSALESGQFKKVPMMTGVMGDDGVLFGYFLRDRVDRATAQDLRSGSIVHSILDSVISASAVMQSNDLSRFLIGFHSFKMMQDANDDHTGPASAASSKVDLMDDAVGFFTDAFFVAPLQRQIRLTAQSGGLVYFYVNNFQSPDIFGNGLLSRPAAPHGSDLLFLFGPAMCHKFLNRGFKDLSEERMSRSLKMIVGDFASTGSPPAHLQWLPFTPDTDPYLQLDTGTVASSYKHSQPFLFWYKFLPQIESQLLRIRTAADRPVDDSGGVLKLGDNDDCPIFVGFTWALLAVSVLLLLLLLLLVVLLKRRPTWPGDTDERRIDEVVYSLDRSLPASLMSYPHHRQMTLPPGFEGPAAVDSAQFKHRWRHSVTDQGL